MHNNDSDSGHVQVLGFEMERLHFYFFVQKGWDHPCVPRKQSWGRGLEGKRVGRGIEGIG